MPYRILARNKTGNTVTRWDMRNPKPITDPVLAQQLADDFASRQVHAGPWQGVIEYYEESNVPQATRLEQRLSKMTPKARGVSVK